MSEKMQTDILEIKMKFSKMKNKMGGINGRLDIAEEKN